MSNLFSKGAMNMSTRASFVQNSPRDEEYAREIDSKCPIVYRDEYNTDLCGLQQSHPFDAHKWGKVFRIICEQFPNLLHTAYKPDEITSEQLLVAHSKSYLRGLQDPIQAAKALELPIGGLSARMAATMDEGVLRPMRFQTGGTLLAAQLAVQNQRWAINIGGGFHHASGKSGGAGFCIYADITIAIRQLMRQGLVRKVLIVDLDAHQGNGHERDFLGEKNVYIFDMYNKDIYPHDMEAFETISSRWHMMLESGTDGDNYLRKLSGGLKAALEDFGHCDLIVYNAGTDLLAGDHLGCLNVSYEAVIKRDEFVFRTAREHKIPIVMVTSGGYSIQSGQLIADSILNLQSQGLINLF